MIHDSYPVSRHRATAGKKILRIGRKMDATALNEEWAVARVQLAKVKAQLANVESKLREPGTSEANLLEEKKQLREKEKQIREEGILLLQLILRQSPGKY